MTIEQRHGQGLKAINRNAYENIHQWLRKHYKKSGICNNCAQSAKTEWSLKRGKVYEKNREAFIELCISCHKKYDVTDQLREKHRQRMLGKTNPSRWKAVVVVIDGRKRHFESITKAAKELSVNKTSILNMLAGRAKTAGGYTWQYDN